MNLDPKTCYQALRSRDRRFDGHFFVGVKSTGIYCRPICPAKLPKPQNCQFFQYAASAEYQGFRPCLRCRPEIAPSTHQVSDQQQLLDQACRLIDHGFLNHHAITELAEKLNITDRHLRRLFKQEMGIPPQQYLKTSRLLLAKQLLTDTQLPITDIALQSGFNSQSHFNSQFKEHYKLNPSQLRSNKTNAEQPITLKLSYRPPYDWPLILSFLKMRLIPGVEAILDNRYLRTVKLENNGSMLTGWLTVEANNHNQVCVTLSPSLATAVIPVLQKVRYLFDLDCNPEAINEQLSPLSELHPGLRLPGAFDGFEMSIRAILGQQVTVKAAHTLAKRIAHRFGQPITTPFAELNCLFPDAETLARLTTSQIAELGIVQQRSNAIIAMAQTVIEHDLKLSPGCQVDLTLQRLQSIKGIGPWTCQYIAMRALRWPDAFPDTDLGVIKAVGSKKRKEILAVAEKWRPWRAYAVIHLWHRPANLGPLTFET